MTCRRHPDFDPDCFACKVKSVSFSAAATPTRRLDTVATVHKEARWGPDMDAYRRLRRNGLQPRSIDGSAELEKHASTQMEVEYGHLLTKPQIREASDAMDLAREYSHE